MVRGRGFNADNGSATAEGNGDASGADRNSIIPLPATLSRSNALLPSSPERCSATTEGASRFRGFQLTVARPPLLGRSVPHFTISVSRGTPAQERRFYPGTPQPLPRRNRCDSPDAIRVTRPRASRSEGADVRSMPGPRHHRYGRALPDSTAPRNWLLRRMPLSVP